MIAGAFVDFLDQGYVYKGLKPVHWCIKDRTALAEAEVEYADHTSPSIWVRFRADVRPGDDRSGARRPQGLRRDLDHHAVDHSGQHGDRLQPELRVRGGGCGGRRVPRGGRRLVPIAGLVALASTSLLVADDVSAGRRAAEAFDPLLNDPGGVCGPVVAAQPALLQALILAKAETAPFQPVPMQAAGGDVRLYSNLGSLDFKVSTHNAKAQAYFNQGMRLAFGFNHAEAQRAFQAAQ